MNDVTMPLDRNIIPLRVWSVGAFFVLFQFFLQLSSGVIIGEIMHDMHLSALEAGLLSSAFYVIYVSLQIPVGILLDLKNARYLLTIAAFICSMGCFVFAHSFNFSGLVFGRLMIGSGSAFAFVGLTHLVRQYFRESQFALMIGLSETIGLVATVIGIIGLGAFITHWGWRPFVTNAAMIGLCITALCWRYIPNELPKNKMHKHTRDLGLILSNLKIWNNGLFIAFTFALVTVFGALWSVPFMQLKLHCSLREASFVNALFFLGTGVSCPLFGYLSSYFSKRRPLILSACAITTLLFLCILYLPIHHLGLTALFMFLLGICCSSYILSYPIANELSPPGGLSTCTGFINTLAVITTPILQTLVGFLLDFTSGNTGIYTLKNYQTSLLILPSILLISCVFAYFLPEKE